MDESLDFSRGETRRDQKGWVAWIDQGTNKVHVQEAICIRGGPIAAVVRTTDGEHELEVPHGRLNWSPAAACDQLAIDVREEGEQRMKPHQTALAAVARELLLTLIAVELAKSQHGSSEPGKLLEQRPRLEDKRQN